MELKAIFDEAANNYDKWRPQYCEELFEDIIKYSGLDNKKNAVEIGCGTGQATEPILRTGCSLTAVEYGKNLADFTRKKFEKYDDFRVQNIGFEEFECENNSVDLVYSATAFHWIPEEIGYKKVYDMLKPGGTIAVFWNKPFPDKLGEPLYQKMQELYSMFRAGSKPPAVKSKERYNKISDTVKRYGFTDVECRIYKQVRTFSSEDYISLLNTYSDHRAMPQETKEKFEAEMKAVIDSFGGFLNVYDTIDLYLGRK